MRKISWICLTALLLSCILLLNACSFGNTLKLSKLFDESKFREPYVPTSATLISELNDATPVGSSYSYGTTLQLFSKDDGEYTKYMVYNVEIGKIVLTKTETEIRDYSISITEDNSLSPIIVVLTENYSSSEDDEADYTTTLYNADGTEIASAQGDKDYTMSFDMVYFDGKVYRLNEDSQFEYVFDYSPLAEFPNVIYKSGKYYLAGSDDCISAYNQELELVGTYVIPSYLQEDATAVALTDGKLFIQTLLELDAMATAQTDDEKASAYDRAEDELGDFLFATVNAARLYGLNPYTALERTCAKFRRRFTYLEEQTIRQGRNLTDMTLAEMDAIWDEGKAKGL